MDAEPAQVYAPGGGVNLHPDKYGYYKRQVYEDKCIDCGKCLRVCPARIEPVEIGEEISYVAYCRNREDTLKSSSGGMGYLIAQKYMEAGYAIIGATWSKDFRRVEHIAIKDLTELEALRKSKYVQSYTVDAFRQIPLLDKVVIFGTPCQIAGVRNMYGNRKGMILVDFDCMGPSGLVLWNKYVDYISEMNDSGIKSINMRHKKKSWMMYGTRIEFNNGAVYYRDKFHDAFCIAYHLAGAIHNTCTKKCKFQNSSQADLRIGDGWGYVDGFGKQEIHDGLSLMTPLTTIGTDIIKNIQPEVKLKKVNRKKVELKPETTSQDLMECIRNKDTNIHDVVAVYNSVGIFKRIYRRLSYILSKNDTIYLLTKRLIKKFW